MAYPVITIGRQFGSGGRIIAQQVAKELDIPFYDKAVIDLAAQETGLSKEFIRQAEQKRSSSFLYNLYMSTQSLPINDQVFLAESEVIKKVAAAGPCVIVGRCSNYILRDIDHALHVFIHAPMEQRLTRAREVYGLENPDLRHYINKKDKSRASYYDHYVASDWGRAENYHLCISSALGLETTADLIVKAAKGMETE